MGSKRKAVAMFLVLLVAFYSAGCPKGLKGLATASDTIAHALDDAQQGVALGAQSGVVSAKEQQDFNEYLAKLSLAGTVLDQSIRQSESATTMSPKVNAFLDAFKALNTNGVAGIKNANTRLAVATALNSAEAAVAIIAAAVGK